MLALAAAVACGEPSDPVDPGTRSGSEDAPDGDGAPGHAFVDWDARSDAGLDHPGRLPDRSPEAPEEGQGEDGLADEPDDPEEEAAEEPGDDGAADDEAEGPEDEGASDDEGVSDDRPGRRPGELEGLAWARITNATGTVLLGIQASRCEDFDPERPATHPLAGPTLGEGDWTEHVFAPGCHVFEAGLPGGGLVAWQVHFPGPHDYEVVLHPGEALVDELAW